MPIAVRGTALELGTPVPLFSTEIVGGSVDAFQGRQYDVTRDGRFLIDTAPDEVDTRITLIQHWNPEAKP